MSGEFAGMLSERILIEQLSAERDPGGLQQPIWETVCTCSASIRLDGVGVKTTGQALSAMSQYRVTIRRREGIALDQRITWGTCKMMIRQLLDDPTAKDRISMRCEEIRA